MSQPSQPWNGCSLDPALLSTSQGDSSPEYLNTAPNVINIGTPTFSSADSPILERFNVSFDNASLAQPNCSTTSTPELSGYTFGHRSAPASHYPTLASNSPNSYPLQIQRASYSNSSKQTNSIHSVERPLPIRTQTVSSHLHTSAPESHSLPSLPRTQQPYHRRSLSQGDADRIAALEAVRPARPSNPVFFRLQVPRAHSTTPEDEARRQCNRLRLNERDIFELCQSHYERGNASLATMEAPTSIPPGMNGIAVPIPIGVPLGEVLSPPAQEQIHAPYHEEGKNRVVFRYMSGDNRERGMRVIEIGAMAVLNTYREREDVLDEDGTMSTTIRILKKLDELQEHLNHELEDSEMGDKGCDMIREALEKKKRMASVIKAEEIDEKDKLALAHITSRHKDDDSDDPLPPPSHVFDDEERDQMFAMVLLNELKNYDVTLDNI
ncbi:hypothetical protein BS50DRAFT_668355 [Corynespora cassiicola Philippines]|uniref:Uncharacterized protein n=1 Tax=Corynespora cassiicola Philippines TaxID=1448308 RepID=A0A2T2NK69_CORCC|nr:hypothetical protein BS50DRAFT_668355 [Corynespora cassiicola Philippines]